MLSFLTFILAILALSFLIFIHELGHYFMARRVGMKVDVFSIGFGKPVYSWLKDGVRWQIGWLPFGGYVKIAGTDTDKQQDLYAVKDGFFGKGPWDRIKVAATGPLVNLVFALLVFALLWVDGGREKNFSEFTTKIGWVDPHSELYKKEIRPGDEIRSYDHHPYQGAKDHLYFPLVSGDTTTVAGFRVNYAAHDKTPFEFKVARYPNPYSLDKGIVTVGILNPASYLVYNRLPDGRENPLPEGSPLRESGIQYGDRIVWVDGHLIFSVPQLTSILNDGRTLLTVERGDQILFVRAPRIKVAEFKLDPEFREELVDWQYEGELKGVKTANLYALPYNLTHEGVVENPLKFIDKEKEKEAFPPVPYSYLEEPLLPRDKIIAVDGRAVKNAYQILQALQDRQVHVVVERNNQPIDVPSWKEADQGFDEGLDLKALDQITHSIGSQHPVKEVNKYVLLHPVQPRLRGEFVLSPEKEALFKSEMIERRRQAEAIEDPEARQQALTLIDSKQKEYVLGLPMIQDRKVEYNPIPTELFGTVFGEIWRTLGALFSGTLNLKWLSGPVGIVQVVHNQAMLSLAEMLFWMGAISLNLAVLNLLPIPMLDGGTILLSLFELITKKQLKPKTLERLILPFAILLILFFIFVTYHDLTRIFGNFLRL